MKEILENGAELPKGFDLQNSIYNYSCNLAITMWQESKNTM